MISYVNPNINLQIHKFKLICAYKNKQLKKYYLLIFYFCREMPAVIQVFLTILLIYYMLRIEFYKCVLAFPATSF